MSIVKDSEPNDTPTRANPFTLGDTLSGSLLSSSDWDFYKVTLSSSGVIKLDVSVTSMSNWAYSVTVYDANGNALAGDFFGYDSTGGSLSVGVATAGTYYVGVTSSNITSTNPYTIVTSAGTGSAADYEKEGNDTQATATAVSMDHVITGQRGAPTDVDYYAINADSSGVLTVDFQCPEKEYFADYQIGIYDSTGKLIDSRTGNGNMTLVEQGVAAGKYYLRFSAVKDASYEGGNYKFVAHMDAASTLTNASTLTSSAAVTGTISGTGQHNWYKVTLTAGGLYEFSASGLQSGGGTLATPSITVAASDGHALQNSTNLATYTDAGGQLFTADPQVAFVAPYSGTYYVMVDGLGGAGTYTVQEKIASQTTLLKSLFATSSTGADLHWGSSAGAGATVTYAFMTTSQIATQDGETGFKAMTDTQKQAVRTVLAMYGSFANLTFTEVADPNSADIRYGTTNQAGVSAGVSYSGWNADGSMTVSDVYINNTATSSGGTPSGDSMYAGGYGYETLIHETGHALGLKHPGDYNAGTSGGDPPYISAPWDSVAYTIMSYIDDPNFEVSASTPAALDVAAIQYLYGARTSTSAQTQTFGASGEFKQSVIATGAVTLDLSNQTSDNFISATPGTFSSIGLKSDGTLAHDNVAIPFNVNVKSVIGGSGNDYILGGPATALYGGGGNDIFNGCTGKVAVNGGDGTDMLELSAALTQEHLIKLRGAAVAVADSSGNVALCRDVEQFHFSDTTIATSSLSVHDSLDLPLTQIYVAAFRRAPETGGYNYWVQEEASRGLTGIADVIFSLDIVKAIYPTSMSASDFVTAIYLNVFNRAPDTDGLNYWVQQLNAKSRGQLVIDMTNAALGTPDGTSGKDYFENRVDWSLYAVGYQLDKSVELTPDHLTTLTTGVTADASTVITLIGQGVSGTTL